MRGLERKQVTILLVDECPLTRSGVRSFLISGDKSKVVGEAGSAAEAVELW